MRLAIFTLTVIGILTAALAGCSDRPTTFFKCTACLADDHSRCATETPVCGDSTDRQSSEIGAKDALCDTLSPADLAARPTPTGFKPNPYLKNACYEWPDDAFQMSCTTFTKTCGNVPIH